MFPHDPLPVCPSAEESSASLETELNQLRERYQDLIKEYSRLELRYDNLKEEMALSKVSWTGPVLTIRPRSVLMTWTGPDQFW